MLALLLAAWATLLARNQTLPMTVLTTRSYYAEWDDVVNELPPTPSIPLALAYAALYDLSVAAGCETPDPDRRQPHERAPRCTCMYRKFFEYGRDKANWTAVPKDLLANASAISSLSSELQRQTAPSTRWRMDLPRTDDLRGELRKCTDSRPVYQYTLYGVVHPLTQLTIVLCIGSLCFINSMTRDLTSRSNAWWGTVLVESALIAAVSLGAMLCYGPTYGQAENALGTFETILYLLYGWVCTRWSVGDEDNKEEYLWRYVRLAMPIHFLIASVCGDVRDLMGVATLVSVGYMVGFTLQQCYIASVVGRRALGDSVDAGASSWWQTVLWHLGCDSTKEILQVEANWIGACTLGVVLTCALLIVPAQDALFARSTHWSTTTVGLIVLIALALALLGINILHARFKRITSNAIWSLVHAGASILLVSLLLLVRFP